MKKGIFDGAYGGLVRALLISNGVSLLLFAMRVWGGDSFRYWFLFWNLILAWVPLLLAYWLKLRLSYARWKSPASIGLTVLWLAFLPNSFYIVSDLIHVHLTGEVNILFDVVLFASTIFNGYVFGYISLYMVHRELIKRLPFSSAHKIIAGIILICSFSIYLGRYLRWNTWDILVHPVGILFDVSDRFINPAAHPQTFVTTATFFLLIGSIYLVIYEFLSYLRSQHR